MLASLRAAEISAQNITKKFGEFCALDDVSFSIGSGEFLTLLGPSGSGKSTFLMVLAGFEAPNAGLIVLDGKDITNIQPEERGFGMVFQGYALFPHMTAEQNISFPLKVQGRGATEIKKRVAQLIEMVGLGEHGHKRPSAMSGGQQQRVALARALACEPPVMLLDEPFSALDKNLREQMQDEMRRIHKEIGTTFVFVTHDQSEALALSNRVAIFDHGKLQQIGAPRDVYERPENRFVAEFLGDINILPLTSISKNGSALSGHFEDQPLFINNNDIGIEKNNFLAIRPEHMKLSVAKPKKGNSIKTQIVDITYQGAQTRLSLMTNSGVPIALSASTATLPANILPGSETWIGWSIDRGYLLASSP
ncbi:MAG: ABC transporter ATP-binding protein [Salaquimonas sp.]